MYPWVKGLRYILCLHLVQCRKSHQSVLHSTVVALTGDQKETFSIFCICICDLLLIKDPDTKADHDVLNRGKTKQNKNTSNSIFGRYSVHKHIDILWFFYQLQSHTVDCDLGD